MTKKGRTHDSNLLSNPCGFWPTLVAFDHKGSTLAINNPPLMLMVRPRFFNGCTRTLSTRWKTTRGKRRVCGQFHAIRNVKGTKGWRRVLSTKCWECSGYDSSSLKERCLIRCHWRKETQRIMPARAGMSLTRDRWAITMGSRCKGPNDAGWL